MHRRKNEHKLSLEILGEQRHRSVFDLRELHEIINEKLVSKSETEVTSTRQSIYKPHQFMVTSSLAKNLPLQMAIAAIEEKTSDDELEESEGDNEKGEEEREDKYEKARISKETVKEELEIEEFEEVEEVEENIEIDSLSGDLPESDIEWDYLKQHELKDNSEFFEHNVEVPDIEEISIDIPDFMFIKPKKPQPKHGLDSGEFVNPLTGLPILDSSESIEYLSESFESEIEEADSEDFSRQSILFDVSQNVDEKDDNSEYKHERHSPEVEDDVLHFFLHTEKVVEELLKTDTETTRLQKQKILERQNAIKKIIYEIIDNCVESAELLTKDAVLRSHLDKRKLLNELKSKNHLLMVEKSVSHFLNKKIVDHFKRKKAFSQITTEKSDNRKIYLSRYKSALDDLDKILSKEKRVKATSTSKIIDLENQFKNIERESKMKVDHLEQMIRTTFERKNFPKVQCTIDNSVQKMSEIRNEISKVRLRLLLKQHQFSHLKKQKQNFENIGNGLTVTQFESLETETCAIGKKLEEQITFLKKLYNTCDTNFHKIAHLKEKHIMMKKMMLSQKAFLEDMLQARSDARENVTKLKTKHNELRYEIDYITFQNGVLFKPLLIKDYDKTVERISEMRETNADLKKQIKQLNTIIDSMEKTCAE